MATDTTRRTQCERCGKQHIGAFVWLELNTYTGLYDKPGTIPKDESQGLFMFGPACARTVLKNNGHNKQIRKATR
jgi:hypothetical protein